MNSFALVEEAVSRAQDMMVQQKYDIAKQLLIEALGQFEMFKRSLSSQEQQQYAPVDQAIRDELQLIEDVIQELKHINDPVQRAESADQVEDSPRNVRNDRPNQYRQPAPSYKNVQPRVYKTPSIQAKPEAPKSKGKIDYDRPWKQEKPADKPSNKGDPDKPKKPSSDLPTSYDNVDARFVDEIHAILIKNTGVSFSDIAGLDDAKRLLTEAIILPMQVPELFQGPMAPWKGVLLYGPPGTGKTELAKAFATEAKCCFFAASASTIMSKFVGDSEKVVKALFTIARFHAPSIIFMDEIDALMSANAASSDNPVGPRLRQEILTQMQGVASTNAMEQHVVVLAATNHPWNLDEALRRRLEKRIYLPLPELETRLALVKLKLRQCQVDPDLNVEEIAQILEGYSGSDIGIIVRESLMNQVRKVGIAELAKNKDKYLSEMKIGRDDFLAAINKTKPSVAQSDIAKYLKFKQDFSSE
ncbi:Katanin_(p60) [Hexamita inflata]|uniref:Katanin (p60) n=1 Tax=Hexamita inflata TaxID=28002 RepID=A0AA86PCM3_9EUKA|nr:Katanin (p60) [Hexamita inflata]